MKLVILTTVALLSWTFEAGAQDSDLDGVLDSIDNCSDAPNSQQLDPDLDGYGNSCDADFDQDGDTDQVDVDFCLSCTSDPRCDMNEDGTIGGFDDYGICTGLFGSPPGPSGLACAGTVPCTAPPAVPGLGVAGMGALLLALIASAVAIRRRWMTA